MIGSSFAIASAASEMIEFRYNVGLNASRAQIAMAEIYSTWHGCLPFELADRVNEDNGAFRWKGGAGEKRHVQLRLDYVRHGDDVVCRDPEVSLRHFRSLCERVASLDGVASAICAVRTDCKHGRHAVACRRGP